MKKSTTLLLTLASLATIIVGIVGTTNQVNAQANSGAGGQALEIGPPVINLSADPGTTVSAKINIRDVSTTSLLVTAEINDFVAGGEDGTPKVILDGSVSKYSLKPWIAALSSLTLKPREIRTFTININVPADASPGGYYGVVRFTGTPPDLEGAGVSLSASIGSLILLKVNGDAKESMVIEEFSASHDGRTGSLFEAAPIVFTERLKNTGNIQQEPTGLVTVKDMFGNVVATLAVNQPVRNVLPDSIRKFESSMDSTNIGNKILFGLYTADLSVTYGTNKETITSSMSFWVIPYTLIAIIIATLIVGFIVIRSMIRRYNRHIVKKVRSGKM
ncbi:hypothetical protein BH10PAT4_BH10PAT4_0840 [soil metagenome]